MMQGLFATLGMLVLGCGVAAAQEDSNLRMKLELERVMSGSRILTTGGFTRSVKGAPFSGQEIREDNQVLADGTRIHNETRTNVYRDSEGRVRREAGDQTTITDPVVGVTWLLDAKAMTATKLPGNGQIFYRQTFAGGGSAGALPPLPGPGAGHVSVKDGVVTVERDGKTETFPVGPSGEWSSGDGKMHVVVRETAEGKGAVADKMHAEMAIASAPAMVLRREGGKGEELGEQVIEGVKARGTRTTSTIQAGAIGNDRPLTSSFESWYSEDLQMEIMSKRSDPRMGDSNFRLTNINRSEPAAYLFQVPAGYTTTERK